MEPVDVSSGDGSPPKSVAALQRHYSKQSSRSQSSVISQVTETGLFASSASASADYQRLLPEKTWAGLQSALYSMELPTQPLQQTLQQLNGGLQQASSTSSSQQLGHSNSMQHVQVGASVDSCDLNRVGAELQQRRGRLSSIDLKLQQAAAQRPSTRPSSSRDNQAAGGNMLDSCQDTQGAVAAADISMSRPGTSSSIARDDPPVQQADKMLALQTQLAALRQKVTAAKRSVAASAATGVSSSRNSSTDQPLTPALAPPAGQQPTQTAAAAQQLARSGLLQLQDMAQVTQHVQQLQSAISSRASESGPKDMGLNAFFLQHPELQHADALRELLDAKKQLKQELFAKQQSLNHTMNTLAQHNQTPADKKASALRQQLQQVQEQLLARDAALAAAEEQNRRLRYELGIPQFGSDFSPSPIKLLEGPAPGSGSTASPDITRRLAFDADVVTRNSMRSSSRSSSSVAGSGSQQQQQQQQHDVPATMIKQLAASYQAALDAKDLQVQQLQRQVVDLQSKQQSSLQALPSLSPNTVQQRLLSAANPRTLDEAVRQITTLQAFIAKQQQQIAEQEQQASRRAAERETAFRRQLEVEKKQHDCTRANCKLIAEQLELLQERLAKSRAQEVQLQQQLAQAQDQLQHVAGAGTARRRTEVDHINQLQQHIDDQKQQIAQLQGCIQSLHCLVKDAGRLVGAEARQQGEQTQVAQDVLMQVQLVESIKQLIAQASRPAGSEGGNKSPAQQLQLQQLDLQQLQQHIEELEQDNDALQQEVDHLAAHKQQSEQAVQQCAHRMQQSEQMLAGMMAMKQELADAKSQLDKALQEQQLAAAHLEQCRQQLAVARHQVADREAERSTLMDRIRELADRASAAEISGRVTPGTASAAEMLQQQLSQACSELNQQVLLLRQQLGEAQVKEERLQVMNAQLQERNAQLQEQISNLQVGAGDAAALQAEHAQQQQQAGSLQQQVNQQQQHIQELQQQLEQHKHQLKANGHLLQEQQQQLQQAQQQLQQKEQQLQEAQHQLHRQQQQQQQPVSAVGGDASVGIEQLRRQLEERTQELTEWQIHADALEKDLADLKEQAAAADTLQDQLEQQHQHAAALEADKQQLQQELQQMKTQVGHLEFELHDAAKNQGALLIRFEAVTAELSRVKEGAADMRLKLEHLMGPAGPHARTRQLEVALQSMQRKYEAADARAAQAAAELTELQAKLSKAEDEMLALEGQVSILDSELAKYTP